MRKNKVDENGVITIKKYANRRLYNTGTSSYITLDDLAKMVRENVDFQVVDAKSGDDITHSILTQIIMEEEASGGEQLLPVGFLRQLIALYGNSVQAMVPHYLEASMNSFRDNQAKLREGLTRSVGPTAFARIAETNMKMFQSAMEAFIPGATSTTKPRETQVETDSELDELRAQMAAMQAKLDKLDKE